MAEVAAVYDLEPTIRTPLDVVEDTPEAKERRAAAPRAKNKRVWASVEDDAADVINDAFEEALRRDPEKKRRWVVLVDGNEDQLRHVRRIARHHAVCVTIVRDFAEHWRFHLAQEHDRVHASRYASRKLSGSRPRLKLIRGGASS
jgi:hypothetical protein